MLTGFEKITEDLTTFEKEQALPLIVAGLRSKVGQGMAVTSGYICERMNDSGKLGKYKLSPVKLRKIISFIRVLGLIEGLCSTSKGYFRANTHQELESCLESLKQRIRQQQEVVTALDNQLNYMRDGEENNS